MRSFLWAVIYCVALWGLLPVVRWLGDLGGAVLPWLGIIGWFATQVVLVTVFCFKFQADIDRWQELWAARCASRKA